MPITPVPAETASEAVIEARVFVREGQFSSTLELFGALRCGEFAQALEGLIATCHGVAAAHGIVLNDDEVPF